MNTLSFRTVKDCLAFFNMMMIENNHRQHNGYHALRMFDVQVRDGDDKFQPVRIVTGLGGDIFTFWSYKVMPGSRELKYSFTTDAAIHSNACDEPLTKATKDLLSYAVTKGHVPIELLMCIHEHRTCNLATEDKDNFDDAYREELLHLQTMLELLV